MNTENNTDFVAIGDMVIDAFIRLGEDSKAHIIEKEDSTREIALPFGDKVPFEFSEEVVAVGNSANASVSVSRIGITSGLVANIGKDRDGERCIEKLKQEKVVTDFVQSHEGSKTNYHYVLWHKDERTILIKHGLFDYVLPDVGKPKFLYLTSISENSLPFHDVIADYLEKNPEIKLVFQPGTFQMKWGTHDLKRIYQRTDIFFCNIEEAERILQINSESKSNKDGTSGMHTTKFVKKLLDGLHVLGPKIPVITDGPDGCYTYGYNSSDNEMNYDEVMYLPIYPDIAPPYERTGAGDAFASTFSAAYLLGNDVPTCLKWAAINSMNVCQHVGAQKGLLERKDIEKYLSEAPADWDVRTI